MTGPPGKCSSAINVTRSCGTAFWSKCEPHGYGAIHFVALLPCCLNAELCIDRGLVSCVARFPGVNSYFPSCCFDQSRGTMADDQETPEIKQIRDFTHVTTDPNHNPTSEQDLSRLDTPSSSSKQKRRRTRSVIVVPENLFRRTD